MRLDAVRSHKSTREVQRGESLPREGQSYASPSDPTRPEPSRLLGGPSQTSSAAESIVDCSGQHAGLPLGGLRHMINSKLVGIVVEYQVQHFTPVGFLRRAS